LLGIAVGAGDRDSDREGFDEPRRQLTITLVRILFPMTGLMVVRRGASESSIRTASSSCRTRRPRSGT